MNPKTLADAIRATLENAVRAPYYARTFGRRWRSIRTLDDLSRLPLLDKLTAIRHQRDLVVGEPPPGFGVASSGTTRRDVDLPPLNVLSSREELEAIHGLDPGGAPPGAGSEDSVTDPYPGWTLVLVSVTHGLPPGDPAPGELHVPWMYDRNALYMLETVLERPQPDGRRVTAMRISVGALKCFTAWLLERGRDPGAFGVKLIGTNSFRLSPFWRALVERKFGAQVFDNYSLSEFSTPATECEACGWLHFGWPPIIYEVLDLASGRRLARGAGRLVLTGVHPFVQKMPLIRYDTGDVLELGPKCRSTGARSVRFLGRVRRGIVDEIDGGGVFALSPGIVQDVLEAIPSTERTAHPLVTLGHVKSRDVGLPRWTVERNQARLELAFEVRFDPDIFEEHARELERTVRRDVLARDPALRRLVRQKRRSFSARAVRAGSLEPPPDKHD